jgi:hypothetical protein
VPVHWIRVPGPGGTPEDIAVFKDNPHGYEQWVWEKVDGGRGTFTGLFFDREDARAAYVSFESVDGVTDVEAIVAGLRGSERTDLDTVTQRHQLLGLGPPPPPPGAAGEMQAA